MIKMYGMATSTSQYRFSTLKMRQGRFWTVVGSYWSREGIQQGERKEGSWKEVVMIENARR
jgi:hypothetical protein